VLFNALALLVTSVETAFFAYCNRFFSRSKNYFVIPNTLVIFGLNSTYGNMIFGSVAVTFWVSS
jgi:hypothetical protein